MAVTTRLHNECRLSASLVASPIKLFMTAWIINENGAWVVQGAEHVITAQGETADQAMRRWRLCIRGTMTLNQREGREPFHNVPSAPQLYWRTFGEPVDIDIYGALPEESRVGVSG